MNLKIFTDGGSRGNPGKAACAFVAYDLVTGNLREKRGKYLGIATNNVAEYQGVLESLKMLSPQVGDKLDYYLDSQLVVMQLKGAWKIKNAELGKLALEIQTHLKGVVVSWHHVPREQNQEADRLVNDTLDHN